MERSTWRDLVLQNKGLKQGDAPSGTFSGRTNNPGRWPADGPHKLTGHDNWELTAKQFTDMCTIQLSHRMRQSNAGDELRSTDECALII